MINRSLQETHAPHLRCFGCGPANESGLHLGSFVSGNQLVAEWQPGSLHEAAEGFMNAGIVGTLLDCHSNWAAAWFIGKHLGSSELPSTVSAEYTVKLLRPISIKLPVSLIARVDEVSSSKAIIVAEMHSEGKLCATCKGLFPVVKPGNPAYHRFGYPIE
jgi:acyl-coenzyme A thioesterase PaaI-like protein